MPRPLQVICDIIRHTNVHTRTLTQTHIDTKVLLYVHKHTQTEVLPHDGAVGLLASLYWQLEELQCQWSELVLCVRVFTHAALPPSHCPTSFSPPDLDDEWCGLGEGLDAHKTGSQCCRFLGGGGEGPSPSSSSPPLPPPLKRRGWASQKRASNYKKMKDSALCSCHGNRLPPPPPHRHPPSPL